MKAYALGNKPHAFVYQIRFTGVPAMKDVHQVLNQKEADLARVRKELESLSIIAPLLADDTDRETSDAPGSSNGSNDKPLVPMDDAISRLSDSAATNADNLIPPAGNARLGFWNSLKRAR